MSTDTNAKLIHCPACGQEMFESGRFPHHSYHGSNRQCAGSGVTTIHVRQAEHAARLEGAVGGLKHMDKLYNPTDLLTEKEYADIAADIVARLEKG